MLEPLWGIKTLAIFDVWTIEHLLSGLSVGAAMMKHNRHIFSWKLKMLVSHKDRFHFDVMGVLLLAFFWETLEHYLETGIAGDLVQYWFQGVEYWPNRLISDPLMLVLGFLLARRYPQLVWPARILSVTWLLVHIFVFPHSMFLHELF